MQDNKNTHGQSDVLDVLIVPDIEQGIPIPKNNKEAEDLAGMTSSEELSIRATTIKEISDITGETIEPTAEHRGQAEQLAEEMMKDPRLKPVFGNYPNETMAYLAGLVAQTNCMLVEEMADFKLYVLNRFVQEAETAKNSKDRLMALKAIGEIDGVDAFKKKSEVLHIHKTGKDLEDELLRTIAEIKGKVIQGEAQIIDVEEEIEEEIEEEEDDDDSED